MNNQHSEWEISLSNDMFQISTLMPNEAENLKRKLEVFDIASSVKGNGYFKYLYIMDVVNFSTMKKIIEDFMKVTLVTPEGKEALGFKSFIKI
jgi:hypothetical protein